MLKKLRVALASFEYSSAGGIGTYLRQAATMLASRGHDVEIFTSSQSLQEAVEVPFKYKVHSVVCCREQFSDEIVSIFRARHEDCPFDVLEGPEYKAEAAGISAAFPKIPLLVRVHGPTFTINESNAYYVSWQARARYYGGAFRRGRLPDYPWRYTPADDPERAHALAADHVMTNSAATAEKIQKIWGIPTERCSAVPYIFNSPEALLEIPEETQTATVLFLGRLEVRKGVLELAKAIPSVLAHFPDVRFRFVGRVLPHPEDHIPLDEHIRRISGKWAASIEFMGGVPYSEVPRFLADADICVFPSDWEASGFVCMEAMAAGRGVIGSRSGGMTEIIEHGRTGLLVPPRDPRSIASAIVELLRNSERRIAMGRAARKMVRVHYSASAIGPLQEDGYKRAIARAQLRQANCAR